MSFSTFKMTERLNADQEKEMATKIRNCEEEAIAILNKIPETFEILDKRPERVERTRAGKVERLHNAINEVLCNLIMFIYIWICCPFLIICQ